MTAKMSLRLHMLLGTALLLTGMLANPWVLERWILVDERLTSKSWVLLANLALAASGILILRSAGRGRLSEPPAEPRRIAFAAAALTVSAIVALGGAELVLRAAVSSDFVLRGDAQREVRWRSRHAGGIVEAQIGYAFDEYDETLGWRPVAGYASKAVRTNARGMRADREYSLAPEPGRRRIVVVGDSFAWGEEVNNSETLEAFLEHALPDSAVLNFAVHGTGTDQQLLRLRRDALPFAPDLVILGFFEDDLERNVMAFRDFAKPRFVLDGDRLRLTNVPVPAPQTVLSRPEPRPASFVLSLVRGVYDDVLDRTTFRPLSTRESWRITRALFGEARRDAEASGARFLLAYFPKDVTARPDPLESLVLEWAGATATPYVSIRPRLARQPKAEWPGLYRAIHLSPEGNRLAADAIAEAIFEQHLLEPEASLTTPRPRAP